MDNWLAKVKSLLYRKEQNDMLRLLCANVLNKVVATLSNMVITRLLSATEYGVWSYVLNVYSYLLLLGGFGLLSGAFQFGAENRATNEKYRYFSYCLKVGEAINVGIILFLVIASIVVVPPLERAAIYLRAYVPILLLEYGLNLFLTIFRCESRIKEYAKILNLNTVLLAVLTGVGAFWGVEGVIAGKYLSFVAAFTLSAYKSRPELQHIKAAPPLEQGKKRILWRYSLFTGLSGAMNTALYLIDVSMVAALIKDPEELAIYKVATLIPNALTFIPSSIVLCVLPDIIVNRKNTKWLKKKLVQVIGGLGAINVLLCGGLISLAPLGIIILSGPGYLDAVPMFRILTLGYFFTGTFRSLCTNVLGGMRHVKINLVISVVAIFSDVLFNSVLIMRHGTVGAAYATFCAEFITSAIAFIALANALRTNDK